MSHWTLQTAPEQPVGDSRVLEEEDDGNSRRRRALQDDEQADEQAEGRAEAAPAPAAPGGSPLQGLGGAMEKSEMVVGTFQVR